MRLNEGVEWAIHACLLLAAAPAGTALPAARLAEYFDLPADYLAKHLQKLSAAGALETRRGRKGGYALARPSAEITLRDIVEAVDGAGPGFQCAELRRRGPSAEAACYRRPCPVARAMWKAEAAWLSDLEAVTLAELARAEANEAPPGQIERSFDWLRRISN